jgi:hypothetical protein
MMRAWQCSDTVIIAADPCEARIQIDLLSWCVTVSAVSGSSNESLLSGVLRGFMHGKTRPGLDADR